MFLAVLILFVDSAFSETRITRLGGRTTSLLGPLNTEDDVRRKLRDPRNVKNIESVLTQAGWSGNMADFDRAAQTGSIGTITVSPGTRLPFLSFLRRGNPILIRDVVWAGARPFDAYTLEVESGGKIYTINLPKPCGNLWYEERAVPAPPPPPPPPPPAPPPPAPEAPPTPEVAPPPEAPAPEGPGLFFLGAFLGKERRVLFESGPFIAADCVTLLGIKGGVLPRLGDNAELELALGGKFVISDDDSEDFDDSNGEIDDIDNSIFADVAIHGLFDGGFVGGGVSFWDITNDDLRTVSLLLQVGFGSDTVMFSAEGRVPFEELSDAGSNYMFWAGVRIRP